MAKGGHNRIDLTGQRFGRLFVVSYAETRNRKAFWQCICDCGESATIYSGSLRYGDTQSCGCLRSEMAKDKNTSHGLSHHRFYQTWVDMRARCCDDKHPWFKDYGGRGITVCAEWLNDVATFLAWCDSKDGIPSGYSLDRYPDKNGNYEPANCRFASPAEQSRNTRSNIIVEYNGEHLIFKDFVEKYGIVCYDTAKRRHRRRGWDPIRAAFTPSTPRELRRSLRP